MQLDAHKWLSARNQEVRNKNRASAEGLKPLNEYGQFLSVPVLYILFPFLMQISPYFQRVLGFSFRRNVPPKGIMSPLRGKMFPPLGGMTLPLGRMISP